MADLDQTRRNFLSRLFAGLGIIAGLEAAWITLSALGSRRHPPSPQRVGVLELGTVDQYPPGSVTPIPEGELYLARLEDGGFLALHRKCTHLGCSVPWQADENRFACPCHASAFDIRGAVLSAPAPRPLDVFPVRIRDRKVLVDTTRKIRRSSVDPQQIAMDGSIG